MWQDSDITGGKIRLKFSTTQGETIGVGGLAPGEIAINVADGKIFYKKSDGTLGTLLPLQGGLSNVIEFTADGLNSVTIENGIITNWFQS